jgi:carbonyl reductase 1
MSSKVAIVTGGNKGLGFAIVKGLAKSFDGDVYLTARSEDRGQTAVKELEAEILKVHFHQLDIDNEASIQTLATFIKEKYGGLDLLVNNAAIAFKKDNIAQCIFSPNFVHFRVKLKIELKKTILIFLIILLMGSQKYF